MNRLTAVLIGVGLGFALAIASLAVRAPVMETGDPAPIGYLHGAPSPFFAAPEPNKAPEQAQDWIIPDDPHIGQFFVIPFLYDAVIWSLPSVALVLLLPRIRRRADPG
jgi:hypothetical protein